MLIYIAHHLFSGLAIVNLIHYITFRSMGAFLTGFLITMVGMPPLIKKLKLIQNGGQPIRIDGPESHLKTKVGTPTMGGLMIVIGVICSILLWADITNILLWIVILVFISYGMLGFIDDFLKVTKRNSKGVSGKFKLLVQFSIAALAYILYIHSTPEYSHHSLNFPFFKNIVLNLGWFYIAFAAVVIVGASNAVNLTDGLDGLAIVPTMVATGCYALITYLVGHKIFADYLFVQYIPSAGELTVLCAAVIGSGLGFLWYNAQPAQIFMGDTGSLSLGGLIGTIAMITKHEIILILIGGLFVIEAVSVILQVYYFKLTGGKRIFKMAPLHHHFEKLGWPETRVVVRFWIVSIIFAIIGIASLKLR